jgi:hypothetical protein
MRAITAYAVIKNNKLDANEIYKDNDVILTKGEKLVRVKIEVYETNKTKKKK